jgi:cation diffusion facilitator family transporter
MSAEGGTRSIIAALSANLGIALVKFVAFAFSGSSSMLAEGVHSVADTANQFLLLIGKRRARRQADAEHPFGYGRERYVFAFVVSIMLFSVGGVFSVYEGIEKLEHPEGLGPAWWLPLLVIVIAGGLEGFSFRTALREAKEQRGSDSLLGFIRHAKAPEIPVVMLEDFAALVGLVLAFAGVGLTALTGNGVFDAIATVLIGVLLVLVALLLGVETQSLLVGEGASPADAEAIRSAIEADAAVERIIHLKTLYLGPDELMLAAKVAFSRTKTLGEVSAATNALEARVRAAVPATRVIYIEPDVYVAPNEGNPPTDVIVVKSAD